MDKKTGIILKDLFLDTLKEYREDEDDNEKEFVDLVTEEIKKAKEGILLSPQISVSLFYDKIDHEDLLATSYAIELCSLIPGVSERAAKLFPILTMKKMDIVLERYLEEASRCYIYGFFLAALIMCRGSIEYSLKKYLGLIESNEDNERYSIPFLLNEAINRPGPFSKRDKNMVLSIHNAASDCIHGRKQIDSEKCLEYINNTKLVMEKLLR